MGELEDKIQRVRRLEEDVEILSKDLEVVKRVLRNKIARHEISHVKSGREIVEELFIPRSIVEELHMEPSSLSILQKCKRVLAHPSALFQAVKDERGIGPSFQYLAVFSLVIAVGSISYLFFLPDIPPESGASLPFLDDVTAIGIIIAIPVYIGTLLSYFLLAGWIHIFAKLFRGKGNYSATYKANVYGSTPSLLFGWIPIAGIAVELYSLYLTILGLSKLHEVSMARAFGMIITSIVIIFVPLIAVIIALISAGLVPDISELLPDGIQQV